MKTLNSPALIPFPLRWMRHAHVTLIAFAVALSGCDREGSTKSWECVHNGDEAPKYLEQIGCEDDFSALSTKPSDASIPGARSVKTVVDRDGDFSLYFQNTEEYAIHWEFVSENLSVEAGLPRVGSLAEFNRDEYYSPSRRFLLGALSHYAGPDAWVYEISPYDTADAEMITAAYDLIVENSFVGKELYFHPTSASVETVAEDLPEHVRIITTQELFDGAEYQPLNLAESYGVLRFVTAAGLDTEYVSFRDIVVLDRVPNDISVTSGIITSEFQTPLSHINVLSANRGTPNMALSGAYDDEELRELEGKWVRLKVEATDFTLEEVDKAEADDWWDANKPTEVQVPGMDLTSTDLLNVEDMLDLESMDLLPAIKSATRAYGGKAAHYGGLALIEDMPTPKGFAVPVYYYMQFMEENGFDQQVDELLADETFQTSAEERDLRLRELREAMESAPVNPDFEAMLLDKLAEFPDQRMRFRSSTNAEDLDGFTGAGLYESRSGSLTDPAYPVLNAVRTVWASVWRFRAFEERSYRSIDHKAVGMALLVHRSFPDEEANGVALTNNPFDKTGAEPAFYINVQVGEWSVVLPEPGTTIDEILYFFDLPGQPITYRSHSNLAAGDSVLSASQVHDLGVALDKIRSYFAQAYAPSDNGWWAMDVEFKFDGPRGEVPDLFVKQARPYAN